jgi:hypothetical protein
MDEVVIVTTLQAATFAVTFAAILDLERQLRKHAELMGKLEGKVDMLCREKKH